ncbi:unnamed protein product [Dicrocoelium dendriticum]|nr:unnamed protein product [Dicrocoelium dendriticum]
MSYVSDSPLNTSISFEIPLDELKLKSPRPPSVSQYVASPCRSIICESDLSERLSRADQRRSSVLSETRNRNVQYVQMVVSKCEQEKERQLNRSMEMDDHIKEDLAKKVERRQKALAERINLAKKQLVKVKQASDARSSSRESLMKHIDKDMSDKENNRRSFIQGIKDHCHMQVRS